MLKVKTYLKSGQIIEFKCTNATFSFSNTSLEFTGYDFKGIVGFSKVSFVPSQIAAYTIIE